MESKHTKGKWKVSDIGCFILAQKHGIDWAVAKALGEKHANDIEEMEANAAYIVKAVNSHEELVKALQDIIEWDLSHSSISFIDIDIITFAKAILQKVNANT